MSGKSSGPGVITLNEISTRQVSKHYHEGGSQEGAGILEHCSMKANAKSHKSVVAAGLKLSAKGLHMVNRHLSTKESSNKIAGGEKNGWIGNHENATSSGRN